MMRDEEANSCDASSGSDFRSDGSQNLEASESEAMPGLEPRTHDGDSSSDEEEAASSQLDYLLSSKTEEEGTEAEVRGCNHNKTTSRRDSNKSPDNDADDDDPDDAYMKYDDEEDDDDDKKYGATAGGGMDFWTRQSLFELDNDPREAHVHDVGIFVAEADYHAWWMAKATWYNQARQRYEPECTAHDLLDVTTPYPHYAFGTKLSLMIERDQTYLNARILGSKLVAPGRPQLGVSPTGQFSYMPDTTTTMKDKDLYYIVTYQGRRSHDIEVADYFDIHEDFKEGWQQDEAEETGKLVTEDHNTSSNRRNNNNDDNDEQAYTQLTKIATKNLDKIRREEDQYTNDQQLDYNDTLEQWDDNIDGGSFVDAFRRMSFTPTELEQQQRQTPPRGCNPPPPQGEETKDEEAGVFLLLRQLLMTIVCLWTEEKYDGVIVSNERGTKHQAIEFYGLVKKQQQTIEMIDSRKKQLQNTKTTNNSIPIVDIRYANSNDKKNAELFFRDDTIKVIECSNEVAQKLEHHIMEESCGKFHDMLSGLQLFEARLSPIRPMVVTTKPKTPSSPAPTTSFRKNPMPGPLRGGTFGIEFELSCALGSQAHNIGQNVMNSASIGMKLEQKKLTKPGYRYTYFCHRDLVTGREWTICHDGSIKSSNADWHYCQCWELKSPILSGREGLQDVHKVLNAVTDSSAIVINDSMGMHVHIGIGATANDISLEKLQSICTNFLIYEDVMDSFLGRTQNKYARTHKMGALDSAPSSATSCIANCQTKRDLFRLMNPHGRYHKLNLDNLRKHTRPTIEFRQHPATKCSIKAEAWIRFCMAFIHNSSSSSSSNTNVVDATCMVGETKKKKQKQELTKDDIDETGYDPFAELFDELIRDESLYHYFRKQRVS